MTSPSDLLIYLGYGLGALWLLSVVMWLRAKWNNDVCSCDGMGPGGAFWHQAFCREHCTCNACQAAREAAKPPPPPTRVELLLGGD